MGLLEGKKAIIFGLANDKSIASGISEAFKKEGAELGFFYASPLLEKRVKPIAERLGAKICEEADLSKDEDILKTVNITKEIFGEVDILVHSVAFAPREALTGNFIDVNRADFLTTLDISVYTFIALTKAFESLLTNGSSVISMTYHGAQKVVPNYNVMGVAKAALEASVRYAAADLGEKNVRVNAISAGPIKTLAASGVNSFRSLQNAFEIVTPLSRAVTIEEVGNIAAFLGSDYSSAITGETVYADNGFNIMAGSKKLATVVDDYFKKN